LFDNKKKWNSMLNSGFEGEKTNTSRWLTQIILKCFTREERSRK
jgi:hypothetical protein